MFNYYKSQTLVEVLVAIGIVTMALISILNIALSYISLSGQTVERTTAIFLAREGLEIVRTIRDSQWLNPTKIWPYGLSNGNWYVDCDSATLSDAGTSDITTCSLCKLYLTSTGKYTHTPNTPTVFRRLIKISTGDDLGNVCPDAGDGCEKQIKSIVYWTERGRSHQIILESRLTDWR